MDNQPANYKLSAGNNITIHGQFNGHIEWPQIGVVIPPQSINIGHQSTILKDLAQEIMLLPENIKYRHAMGREYNFANCFSSKPEPAMINPPYDPTP